MTSSSPSAAIRLQFLLSLAFHGSSAASSHILGPPSPGLIPEAKGSPLSPLTGVESCRVMLWREGGWEIISRRERWVGNRISQINRISRRVRSDS